MGVEKSHLPLRKRMPSPFFSALTALLIVCTLVIITRNKVRHLPKVQDQEPLEISHEQLDLFNITAQYASAAYCSSNNCNAAGNPITCNPKRVCPGLLDRKDTITKSFGRVGQSGRGFIALHNSTERCQVTIVFEGATSLGDLVNGISFCQVDTGLCEGCYAPEGTWKSWQNTREAVLGAVDEILSKNSSCEIMVTGHSLGGAIATLCAAELRHKECFPKLYTFAAPPAINDKLREAFFDPIQYKIDNYRITHQNDPGPCLPCMNRDYGGGPCISCWDVQPIPWLPSKCQCYKVPRFLLKNPYVHFTPEFLISSEAGRYPARADVMMWDPQYPYASTCIDNAAHTQYFVDNSECKPLLDECFHQEYDLMNSFGSSQLA